jgi:hypothetical protein
MFNDITWPEAIVILGVLIFFGFVLLIAAVVAIAKSEDRH